jgi:CheY-like chemotaxis protein
VSDSVGSAVSDLESEALPFKVLVAEDSLANQLALKRMLEKLGAVVTVVADGSEAVDLLVTRGVRYNLALFDLQMPILGGVEAMHYVRDVQIDMPIIAISASVEDAQLQRPIEEGFSMVMIKPMKISTCRDILVKYGHVLPTSLDTGAYLNPATPPPISFSGSSDYLSKLADEDVSALREPSSALRERGVGHVYPPGGNQSTTCIVLLVEDNETSQRIAQRILERDGIVVHVATTGVEAVERAQQTPYDAVLMDCDLPLKDGWQATREIRKWEVACGGHGGKRVPIIAVTANAMRGDRERCLEEGMDDYLSKPVQRVSLLQTAGHRCKLYPHETHIRIPIDMYTHPLKEQHTHVRARPSFSC